MSKISAVDVANVFLKLSEPESGEILTNLKLQKLVYYAQGFHLAIINKPLFEEEILHWTHGPVVYELYSTLRKYGDGQVPVQEDFSTDKFTKEQIALIDEVKKVYGQFSAWKLRDMTHKEKPWLDTKKDEVITKDALKAYFTTLLA